MLHEVLLALSGHASPLFNDTGFSYASNDGEDGQLLSPSEQTLLRSIGQLSDLHRKLRTHVKIIASTHASTICRAVATSIDNTHLARFQQRILDVEGRILTKDAGIVGAYEIVPLSAIVGEFDDWHRRMAWYWDISYFMQPISPQAEMHNQCTGAAIIDRLRGEQQTGFEDVKSVAIELSRVAETAWLRQLSSWVVYGKLLAFGANDFFIHTRTEEDGEGPRFIKEKDLLPTFVTGTTASSILFIGKALHQVRRYSQPSRSSFTSEHDSASESELTARHLHDLSLLSLPINGSQFARAISSIRLSLSQNVLQHLLPMEMTLLLLSCLKQFFLLGRLEFAVTLINEAEARMQTRQHSMGRLLEADPVKALQQMSVKDAELHQALSATWKAMASIDDAEEDDVLDFARQHMTLAQPADPSSRPSTADSAQGTPLNLSPIVFDNLLFPSAASTGLAISPPLDLFISQGDLQNYARINAYLLTIHRAHLRLSDLWRKTSARREPSSQRGGTLRSATGSAELRTRQAKRRFVARRLWATCSAATFLLSETSAYFESEVIGKSWAHFEQWVKHPELGKWDRPLDASTSSDVSQDIQQRDPETLASGHRAFLNALAYALLLNDVQYTRELRSLLGNVDGLIAFFNRVLELQQKIDVEGDEAIDIDYALSEEQRVSLELDRARKKVDSDLKSVVNRLKQLDHERIGSARYLNVPPTEGGFEPWKGGGVDRLLMKLEYGRMADMEERDLL